MTTTIETIINKVAVVSIVVDLRPDFFLTVISNLNLKRHLVDEFRVYGAKWTDFTKCGMLRLPCY